MQTKYKNGKGYMKGDKLVNEPFDFSKKNRLSLAGPSWYFSEL